MFAAGGATVSAPEADGNDDSLLGAVGDEAGLDRTTLNDRQEVDGGSGDSLLSEPPNRVPWLLRFQRRVRGRCRLSFPTEPRCSPGYIVDQGTWCPDQSS